MKQQVTDAQLAALKHCAAINGRTWKAALRHAWETGRYADHGCADVSAELQQVRNTYGPSWLIRFRLPSCLNCNAYAEVDCICDDLNHADSASPEPQIVTERRYQMATQQLINLKWWLHELINHSRDTYVRTQLMLLRGDTQKVIDKLLAKYFSYDPSTFDTTIPHSRIPSEVKP